MSINLIGVYNMYVSEQIENILDNHNLTNDKAIKAMFDKDLTSYENYNGEELIQAVIDNYALELAYIKGERMFMVVDHNRVIQATSLTNEVACVYANSRCPLGAARYRYNNLITL